MNDGLRFSFCTFWISSFLVAMVAMYLAFGNIDEESFEDAALGKQTKSFVGMLGGDRVHCDYLVDDGMECVEKAAERSLDEMMLWLGNSQLHAINQPRPQDELSSVQIARALRPQGIDVITYSQPNANLQEHLVMFEAISDRLLPDVLLLPAVFDDTREGQIRGKVRASLRAPSVTAELKKSEIGRTILKTAEETELDSVGPKTLQERSESAITELLERWFSWEELRRKVRGTIGSTIYKIRNYVFNITPRSVRKKIPAIYDANLAAMEQILISAGEKGVSVLVYIPPIRSDVSRPYNPHEYRTFKRDVQALAEKHGARFALLEDIVPGPLWGTKGSTTLGGEPEYDFMHFQGKGHDILAERLLAEIGKLGQ